jgi:hypothetical protein
MTKRKWELVSNPEEYDDDVFKFTVSNKGRVQSHSGIRSYGTNGAGGYKMTNRVKKGRPRGIAVHALVAAAFVGSPPSKTHTVDHINNDRGDNRFENLQWATHAQQIRYSYERNSSRKFNGTAMSKPVQFRKKVSDEWSDPISSMELAASEMHLNTGHISGACKHETWKAGGFFWRYLPNQNNDLDGEIWKSTVPWKNKDPEQCTQINVSNYGRVKNQYGVINYGSENNGCMNISFRGVRGENIVYKVHSLVLRAFTGEPPTPKHVPFHTDFNSSNNHLSNLVWSTPSEQRSHSHAKNPTLRLSASAKNAKPVLGRKIGDTEEWTAYESAADASRKLNLWISGVNGCCTGTRDTHGGFEFKYAEHPTEADLEGEVWRDVYIRFEEAGASDSLVAIINPPCL